MKFLRKLGSFLAMVLVMAAIAGIVWYAYGDYIQRQIPVLMDAIENYEADAEANSQTEEMRQVLEGAFEHFSAQTLIACESVEERDGEDGIGIPAVTTWDREADLVRQERNLGGCVETTIQDGYNPENYLSNTWTCFTPTDDPSASGGFYYCPNKNWEDSVYLEAEPDTWYHYDSLCSYYGLRQCEFDGNFPYALLRCLDMTAYEVVGTEQVGGRTAVHYIITHGPRLLKYGTLADQYYLHSEERWTEPREFFEKATDQQIKDQYPEFYENFMELVEKRYYQDNQTHLWITEDGELVQAQWDVTFENYFSYFENGQTEEILQMLQSGTGISDGSWDAAFAQLMPTTRTAVFYYGDAVEPIVLPEDFVELAS